MTAYLTKFTLLALLLTVLGCGSATGPGKLTPEQEEKAKQETKAIEDEERGTPIPAKKKR